MSSLIPYTAFSETAQPQIVKLENGLTVVVVQDKRFPLVNIRLYVHAGSAYEDKKTAGISHLLEHMAFKGTDKQGAGLAAKKIESAGGYINAATSFDYTVYYTELPSKDWKVGLDVITNFAFEPTLDAKELAAEQEVVLSELKQREDSPGSRIFQTLQAIIWKNTPYERPIIGFRKSISAISRTDILNYIKRLYQPQNMMLVVVGDVDPKAVLAAAEKVLGAKKNTENTAPAEPFTRPQTKTEVTIIEGDWKKVHLAIAFPAPNFNSYDANSLQILTHLLGGDDSSLLYKKFKYKENLVDQISLSNLNLERGGMLYLFVVLDGKNVPTFLTKITQYLADFDPKTFTQQELDRAKLTMEDGLFLSKETLSGYAEKIGTFQFFQGGEQGEKNYIESIRATEIPYLQELYTEFIRSQNMSVVLLKPKKEKLFTKAALTDILRKNWGSKKRAQAKSASQSSKTQIITLANDSKLILLPDSTLPYTAFSLNWLGGDSSLAKEQQGLATLTASMLTRGTKALSATAYNEFLANRASGISASAGRTTFALHGKFPTKFTKEILPIVYDTIEKPAFKNEEFVRAQNEQLASIVQSEDAPLGKLFRALYPFLFETAPYSYLHLGSNSSLTALKNNDVESFWNKQKKQPFVLSVSGDFDEKEILALAKKLAQKVSTEQINKIPKKIVFTDNKKETLSLPGRNQTHLLAIFPVAGKNNAKETAELELLRAYLTGQSGYLFTELRDKQSLGYTVTAFLWQASEEGFLAFYISTDENKKDIAFDGFKKATEHLQTNMLTKEELQRAKSVLQGEFYQDRQSLLSRANESSQLAITGFSQNYEKESLALSEKATAKSLQTIAQKYLSWKNARIMELLP